MDAELLIGKLRRIMRRGKRPTVTKRTVADIPAVAAILAAVVSPARGLR
jgi:hypothetical protein